MITSKNVEAVRSLVLGFLASDEYKLETTVEHNKRLLAELDESARCGDLELEDRAQIIAYRAAIERLYAQSIASQHAIAAALNRIADAIGSR
jgi:hypothetical protein